MLEYSDGSFNTILELGFASSIRKEWEWRISRGEPIRNLEAFRGPLGLELGRRRACGFTGTGELHCRALQRSTVHESPVSR